jgi:hypothetical protein
MNTGTQLTIVDPSLATELQLETRSTAAVGGIGFNANTFLARVDSLRDQRELFFHLLVGFSPQLRTGFTTIAIGDTFHGSFVQKGVHRLAFRSGIERELITHVLHDELQTGGQL